MFIALNITKQKYCSTKKIMPDKKTFTYVSPCTNQKLANSLCNQLPIIMQPVNTVEELFPLLSDPSFHTDFVCIDIDMFHHRADGLDMFDIIHTLSILIKSTVYRLENGVRPKPRSTKICVIAHAGADVQLVKEVMSFPSIITVSWKISNDADYASVLQHVKQIVAGNYAPHPRVLELIRPKKDSPVNNDVISLTTRQSQILHLIQDRGASNKTIARMLGLSESTIKLHVGAILKKYGVKTRTQLAIFSKDLAHQ